jgi:LytS/YehU family sensor histidine kinase
MKSRKRQILIELIAWMIFIVFPTFIFSTIQPLFEKGAVNPALEGIVITHLLLIAYYYFNTYYAIPKFYFPQKKPAYALITITCLITLVLLLQIDKNFNPLEAAQLKMGKLIFIFSIVLRFIMIFLLSLGISTYNRLKQAEQEKLKTELSYLKAQINPHFLFNTLNSIYALSVKKSDATPESITKLSSIMRYVITEATEDYVSIQKEMDYVSAYIELEKLRLTSKVDLQFSVSGPTENNKIAPLIFIPFIENAFKYGVSTSENSKIEISINLKENSLTLNCFNTKPASRQTKKDNTGLGIENSKKRLNLIYPSKHQLSIIETEKEFRVNLVLTLK